MLFSFVVWLALTSSQPSAASHQVSINVADLCNVVANQDAETDASSGTRYAYQTRLFRSAGVDPHRDGREAVREKMQRWWSHNHASLRCDILGSSGPKHLLKLAVERSAREFIADVTRRWQVDLNYVDHDGATVLDYIEAELSRARGTSREPIFAEYRQTFESRGAGRARELRR